MNHSFAFRPLTITEILDEAFSIYRRNFAVLFTLALPPLVLVEILSGFYEYQQAQMLYAGAEEILLLTFALAIVFMVSLVGQDLATAAIVVAIRDYLRGKKPAAVDSIKAISARLFPLVGLVLLRGLIIAMGVFFCFIPGIILASLLLVTVCVFVLEGKSVTASISRSWNLTSGDGFKAFGLLLMMALISMVISLGLEGAATFVTEYYYPSLGDPTSSVFAFGIVAKGVLQALGSAFVMPVYAAAVLLFYYEMRVRKEAYDVQVLAENLASGR